MAPYNVYIAKAEQTFAFTDSKYNNEESSVEIGSADLTNGKSRSVGTPPITKQVNNNQTPSAFKNSGNIKLVAMNAPSHFELVIDRDNVVIGKKQEWVDLVIPFNRMISRKHCRITNQTGIYYINDEGSANGTFVNGVRLNPGQKVQINRGDIIRMADSDFQII